MDAAASPKGAAFFDLDGTLIPFNSGLRYARWERRHKRISSFQMAQSAFWMVLYHFSLIDMTKAYGRAVQHYNGVPASEIDARTRQWFDEEIAEAFLPQARAAMDVHRAEGLPLVVLSSTSSYMATVVTERWGFDDWLANIFPEDAHGNLTGEFETPLCYGPGKVVRARRWADAHNVDLGASYFYSDSLSDLPMLEAVGHPRVINPDPRLSRRARKNGWSVERWQLPTS